jgi:hypothetical protein
MQYAREHKNANKILGTNHLGNLGGIDEEIILKRI